MSTEAIWNPIETAPKDGTSVMTIFRERRGLLHHPLKSRFIDDKWCGDFGPGGDQDWRPLDPQPTHWMPMPPPPSAEGE